MSVSSSYVCRAMTSQWQKRFLYRPVYIKSREECRLLLTKHSIFFFEWILCHPLAILEYFCLGALEAWLMFDPVPFGTRQFSKNFKMKKIPSCYFRVRYFFIDKLLLILYDGIKIIILCTLLIFLVNALERWLSILELYKRKIPFLPVTTSGRCLI